ncbi:MAG TPA: DUF2723 domain-containing protein [Gemmatimonadaceae bacterium]|nr:DUF2723 domain-containing protein [Gemmatimonadaceae bacterium]
MNRSAAPATDSRPSYLAASLTSVAVFVLYLTTLAPSTAMWDTSEYIAAAYVLGLPHPPGNPLFVLIGRVFSILPIAPNVAMRVNILAALTSAVAAGMWFLITERVLAGWLPERWQRITGGVLAALIGATAFTVWNQSVVNEKVYTVSLMGLAIVSWLTVRWSDDPDGPAADRLLVLIAYLLGLGYANHMMGFLALPAVGVAVLVRRPTTILRWKLVLACLGALALGFTPFLTQPIRAGHYPPINEGEPTTWTDFWYNFNRGQYGKPSVFDRQAPFSGQIGMYWMYFRWQWLRDMADARPRLQNALAAFYMLIGLIGGWVHWKRDRRSFWYFGTFMFTLTVLLIFYLNFKYGYSQCLAAGNVPGMPCEVRDRDYFFIVSFSAWGVWAALGLVFFWEGAAELLGTSEVKVGKTTVQQPLQRSWLASTPILAIAILPLFANRYPASRAGMTDTRDFAHDLLDSVEPYGVLITAGDNDTFPLWYAQEVEGIRKDVTVLCTSLLNTDWYVRQLVRRPVYEYDPATGPAVYRDRSWPKPTGSPLHMTTAQADSIPPYVELRQAQQFDKGEIHATIKPRLFEKADIVVFRIIRDDWPNRPFYFSRTTGSYPQELGLGSYVLTQGLARKLLPSVPVPGRDTMLLSGEGWFDFARTRALWDQDFLGYKAVIKRGRWVDRASVGIPYLYISTAATLAEAESARGNEAGARALMETANRVAAATGLEQIFAEATAPAAPPTQPTVTLPLADSTRVAPPSKAPATRKRRDSAAKH